jgi:peptidoglycan/LPS O-acetylase OafA/YrhL
LEDPQSESLTARPGPSDETVETPVTRSAHIPELDGLRGIAILLVMLFHFGAVSSLAGNAHSTRSIARKLFDGAVGTGWCGVDLFFVISGFLITGILFETKDSPRYYRTFYARRTLRIFPLYYGILIVVFLVLPVFSVRGIAPVENQAWFWLYGANFLRVLRGSEACGALEHFWSLAVEEHFYLVWPFVIFCLSRRAAMGVCGMIVVASLGLRVYLAMTGQSQAAYMLTPARVDAMAVGAFLALAIRGPGGVVAVLPRVRWGAVASGLVVGVLFVKRHGVLYHLGTDVQTFGYTALGIFFGTILLLAASAPSAWTFWLRGGFLPFVGKYSYGIYAYHFLLAPHFARLFPPQTLAPGLWGVFAYLALAMAASIAVAWLSWHAFEKHFLGLKRYFAY